MNAAPRGEEGQASSLYATGRVIGQSLSVALAGTLFAGLGGASAGRALAVARTGAAASGDIVALQQTFLAGFRGVLLACAAVAAVGIFAAFVRGDERSARRPQPSTVSFETAHRQAHAARTRG